MKSLITISKLASEKLVYIMNKNNTNKVLFYIEGGGCNGMKYSIKPIKCADKLEDKIKLQDGYYIHICNKSLIYIIGTHIDWKDDFMGSGLEFTNPNAQSTCGCGETFSPMN